MIVFVRLEEKRVNLQYRLLMKHRALARCITITLITNTRNSLSKENNFSIILIRA